MPGSAWLIWRNELKRLKATTLITFFEVAKDMGLTPKDYTYNAQDSIISFPNGSMIFLIDLSYMPSDPNYDRLGSYWLTYAFIDEAQEISSTAINVLKWRFSKLKGEWWKTIPKSLYTCNPAKNWIYQEFYRPYKNGSLQSYRAFVPSLVTDNPSIAPEYIENLKRADNVTVQRLLYWNFDYDDTPWRLFDYNAILNMWDNPAIHGEKYISWDIARKWKDKSLVWFWNGLDLYKIIKEDKTDLKELSDLVRKEAQSEGVRMSNTIMDENWVWWGIIDNLRCQWFINNARPRQPKKANISTVRNYDMLKTQCYFKLAELVNTGQIRISVEDTDFREKLIEELDIIVEVWLDQDGKTRIIKKEDMIAKLWRSPDVADMVMMRMFYELDKRSPIEEAEEENNEDDPLWIFKDDEVDEIQIDFSPY